MTVNGGTNQYDVIVIGCGPVGAALLNMLGRDGLRAACFERAAVPSTLPRAVGMDDEIMRTYQNIDVMSELGSHLQAPTELQFQNAEGQILVRWKIPTEGEQGWPPSADFHQPELEDALRAGLRRYPHVDLFEGHEVLGFEQNADGVQVTVRDLASGETTVHTAQYVVGCDGASSPTRRWLGIGMDNLGPESPWLVVDAQTLPSAPKLPEEIIQFCWPKRPHMFIPLVDDRVRWEFMVLPDDDREAIVEPESVFRLIERFVSPDEISLNRTAVYTFRSLLAHHWRQGRVLLAGDSAHQQPPLMAQGLCSGIRDAANLSWKLALVCRGDAAPELLDTYEVERAPHVRAWIEEATRLASFVQTTDEAVAKQRDERMLAHPIQLARIVPPLGPGLHGTAPAPAGILSPQPRFADGRLLDETAPGGFILVATPEVTGGLDAATRAAFDQHGAAIVTADDPELAALLERYEAVAVVIRPDRYVLSTAASAAEVGGLLALLPWTAYPPVPAFQTEATR
jgi:3-(3-hydroxy-phenyl)propionate hydroxylase